MSGTPFKAFVARSVLRNQAWVLDATGDMEQQLMCNLKPGAVASSVATLGMPLPAASGFWVYEGAMWFEQQEPADHEPGILLLTKVCTEGAYRSATIEECAHFQMKGCVWIDGEIMGDLSDEG